MKVFSQRPLPTLSGGHFTPVYTASQHRRPVRVADFVDRFRERRGRDLRQTGTRPRSGGTVRRRTALRGAPPTSPGSASSRLATPRLRSARTSPAATTTRPNATPPRSAELEDDRARSMAERTTRQMQRKRGASRASRHRRGSARPAGESSTPRRTRFRSGSADASRSLRARRFRPAAGDRDLLDRGATPERWARSGLRCGGMCEKRGGRWGTQVAPARPPTFEFRVLGRRLHVNPRALGKQQNCVLLGVPLRHAELHPRGAGNEHALLPLLDSVDGDRRSVRLAVADKAVAVAIPPRGCHSA